MRRFFPLFFVPVLVMACSGSGGSGGAAATANSGSADLCAAPSDSTLEIASGGGFTVSQLEWDAELLSIPARARARYENEKGKKDISDRVLLNKGLFDAAEKAGLLKDPAVQMSARMAAEKAYVTALLAQVEGDAATDASVKAYYDENLEKYSRPMVRARHILVKDEGLALQLRSDLAGGADFAVLAKEHSEDRGSKAKGGELPWASRDRWVPAFANAAFATAVNEITDPVKSKFGFHIIQVLEKRDVQPLAEVRPGIERVLTRNAVRDFRGGLKEKLGLGGRGGAPGASATKAGPGARTPATGRPVGPPPKGKPAPKPPAQVTEGSD